MKLHSNKKESKFKKSIIALEISALLLGSAATSVTAFAAEKDSKNEAAVEVIEVTGIRSGVVAGLNVKRDSNQIVDAISAEDMGKFPDANLAEALQRVPDVSIDRSGGEGRYVTIRGLGPQFNNVTLNGRSLATTESSRAFSFDTIAAELVSEMVVYKTLGASIKEGGLGGTVDLKTAKPLSFDGFQARGSIKALHEENSESTKPQGSLFISDTFADDTVGLLFAATYHQRENRTYQINTGSFRTKSVFGYRGALGYETDEIYRPMNVRRAITDQKRERLGLNGVLQIKPIDDLEIVVDYLHSKFEVESTSHAYSQWLTQPRVPAQDQGNWPVGSNLYNEAGMSNTAYDKNGVVTNMTMEAGANASAFIHDQVYRPTTTEMLGLNVDYKINDNINMVFDVAFSSALMDNDGDNFNATVETFEANKFDENGNLQSFDIDFTGEVPAITGIPQEIMATAETSGSDLRVRRAGYNGNKVDAENIDIGLDFEISVNDSLIVRTGLSYDIARKENVNFATPFNVTGFYHNTRQPGPITFTDAEFGQGFAGILPYDSTKIGLSADVNNDILMFDGEGYQNLINDPTFSANAIAQTAQALADGLIDQATYDARKAEYDIIQENGGIYATRTGASYEVEESVAALYVEGIYDFELGSTMGTFIAGLRYVHTEIEATGYSQKILELEDTPCPTEEADGCINPIYAEAEFAGGLSRDTADASYHNWLPSITLNLELTDEVILRVSGSQSLTRPTLSQMGPKFTPSGLLNEQGRAASGNNPALKPFESTNFDISMEYYFDEASVVALALYHKAIDNFITTGSEIRTLEDVIVPSGKEHWRDFRVTQPVNSNSTTIYGASFRLSQAFESGFGYEFNLTAVNSGEEYDPESFNEASVILPGLSNSMNLVGFYENGPLSARLAYNVRQQFLSRTNFARSLAWDGVKDEPVFDDEWRQLDARIGYQINDTFEVFAEGINLTEENKKQSGRYDNLFINSENFGRRYAIGASFKF